MYFEYFGREWDEEKRGPEKRGFEDGYVCQMREGGKFVSFRWDFGRGKDF